MAYATTDDLAARWRPLSTAEAARAAALLDDAAVIIDAECPPADPPADLDARRIVSCAMVKRAMVAGPDVEGVGSVQQTAGPFSQSTSYSNPAGNLYVTKADRRLLGCSRQRAASIDMIGPRP